jgi:hypothetical protein
MKVSVGLSSAVAVGGMGVKSSVAVAGMVGAGAIVGKCMRVGVGPGAASPPHATSQIKSKLKQIRFMAQL